MIEESVQQLSDFCDVASEHLNRLQEQLNKIIKIKEEALKDLGDNMMLVQTGDAFKAVENLKKINEKLPEAIGGVEELCQEIQLLLKKQINLAAKKG